MKLPSIQSLTTGIAYVYKRFPLEVLFALIGTVAMSVNIEQSYTDYIVENWCYRVMMMANLGFLLSLSVTLYSESNNLPTHTRRLLGLGVILTSIVLLLVLDPAKREADYSRFVLLSLSFHLLVSFAAFTCKGHINGFWQFNKVLFLRILTAALYSFVLILGICGAVGAVNYLFNFDFGWDIYQLIWTWIGGMFSTLFFLAGVPPNLTELDSDKSYPKALKVFTQYVLIPLATIYVLILLAYEVKVALEWNLPKGAVSYLILSYAVFGILSLLLVYPIKEHEGNGWMKIYARSFYFLLIPLLVLLFFAVMARVIPYGVTEKRYFLLALMCWLFFITGYFLLSRKQNIKIIPISLCIVSLFAAYGPQSAFSVAMYSQQNALEGIMKHNNAYHDGKLLPIKKIDKKDGNRAVSILDYMIDLKGLNSLQPYFDKDLSRIEDSLIKVIKQKENNHYNRYSLKTKEMDWVKKELNLTGNLATTFSYYNKDNFINVRGYDFSLAVDTSDTTTHHIGNLTINQSLYYQPLNDVKQKRFYYLNINDEMVRFDGDSIMKQLRSINPAVGDTVNKYEYSFRIALPAEQLTFVSSSKNFEVKLIVKDINSKEGGSNINYLTGTYLIREKE